MKSVEPIVLAAVKTLTDPPDPRYPQAKAWTARICRYLNGLPETQASVAYCGLCRQYANPRKRERAARLPPTIPGFGPGAFELHDPCDRVPFRQLRYTLGQLHARGLVQRERVKIPDGRTIKGWDFATNYTAITCGRTKNGLHILEKIPYDLSRW